MTGGKEKKECTVIASRRAFQMRKVVRVDAHAKFKAQAANFVRKYARCGDNNETLTPVRHSERGYFRKV